MAPVKPKRGTKSVVVTKPGREPYQIPTVEEYWKNNDPNLPATLFTLRTFCKYYVQHGYNAIAACKAMGYSDSSMERIAERWMAHPRFEEYVQLVTKSVFSASRYSPDRVITELARLAFANIKDFIDFEEDGSVRLKKDIDRDALSAVAEIQQTFVRGKPVIKIKFYDKLGALEKLAKYFGVLGEKSQIVNTEMDEAEVLKRLENLAEKLRKRVDKEDNHETKKAN